MKNVLYIYMHWDFGWKGDQVVYTKNFSFKQRGALTCLEQLYKEIRL